MRPAIVFLEFDSIAVGILAGDAMVKRASLKTLHTGTVQPGHYLVLAGGEVADLDEALAAAREVAGSHLHDEIFLPDVRDVGCGDLPSGGETRDQGRYFLLRRRSGA